MNGFINSGEDYMSPYDLCLISGQLIKSLKTLSLCEYISKQYFCLLFAFLLVFVYCTSFVISLYLSEKPFKITLLGAYRQSNYSVNNNDA